jgi:hypothetical protein
MLPREYARLARQAHLLGPVSPSTMEATGGTPVDGCRGDDLGFDRPIQLAWWRDVARVAKALTAAGVPYRYVDSDAPLERLTEHQVLVTPTYAYADAERWERLQQAAEAGVEVVIGPSVPTLDATFREHAFEAPSEWATLLDLADDTQVQAAVHGWIDRYDVRRPYPTAPPIETSLHEDETGDRVLFVLNPTQRRHRAKIDLAGPTKALDRLTGELFEGKKALTVPMAPRRARLLSLEVER